MSQRKLTPEEKIIAFNQKQLEAAAPTTGNPYLIAVLGEIPGTLADKRR